MSKSPYSNDLREKVINYLNKGRTQKEASEVFEVHRNIVSRWIRDKITEFGQLHEALIQFFIAPYAI